MRIQTTESVNSAPTTATTYTTAIILASGLGSRFGGDKLLTKIAYRNDQSLPIGLISALNAKPHVDNVICVVRPNDIKLKQCLQEHGFHTVDNPNFNQGLSSSIQAGVVACKQTTHYLICLGDMPYIQPLTYQSVIQYFLNCVKKQPNTIVRPAFDNNKLGHPVMFAHDFKDDLLKLSGDDGGKPIIKMHGINLIAVSDKGILEDIDTLMDIRI